IKPENQTDIARLATQLNKYSLDKLRIVGHTDNVGNPDYNLKLSEERAQSVANVFITQKFDPQNLKVVGKGSTQPIHDNETEEHRAENRRVTVIIIP
ncbi:MAG: OmpA family protein, partial [Acinetobacter sp.]